MLPSRYYPELQGNIYERVAASIAAQLYPDVEMVSSLVVHMCCWLLTHSLLSPAHLTGQLDRACHSM
jgi:uncharacterized membrane protein YagU involved in acid resistance